MKLDPDLAAALSLKAGLLHRTVSDIVNQVVRMSLEEDLSDLAAFGERAAEPTLTLDELTHDLQAHGKV